MEGGSVARLTQIMAQSLMQVGGVSGDHLVQHFAQRRDSSEIKTTKQKSLSHSFHSLPLNADFCRCSDLVECVKTCTLKALSTQESVM